MVQIYQYISVARIGGKYVITSKYVITPKYVITHEKLETFFLIETPRSFELIALNQRSIQNLMQNNQQEKRINILLQAGPAAGWMQVQELLTEIHCNVPCTQPSSKWVTDKATTLPVI